MHSHTIEDSAAYYVAGYLLEMFCAKCVQDWRCLHSITIGITFNYLREHIIKALERLQEARLTVKAQKFELGRVKVSHLEPIVG